MVTRHSVVFSQTRKENHLLVSFVFLDWSKRGWQDLLNVFFIIVNCTLAYRHPFGSSSIAQSQRHRCRQHHLLFLLRTQQQFPTLILHAISCDSVFPYLSELVVFHRFWSDRRYLIEIFSHGSLLFAAKLLVRSTSTCSIVFRFFYLSFHRLWSYLNDRWA